MEFRTVLSILALAAAVAACGDDGGDSDASSGSGGEGTGGGSGSPSSSSSGTGPSTFACGNGDDCKAGEEYCVLSITNGVESAASCAALPSGCGSTPDCDCGVTDDAVNQSANCDGGLVSCSTSNLEIVVACEKSL